MLLPIRMEYKYKYKYRILYYFLSISILSELKSGGNNLGRVSPFCSQPSGGQGTNKKAR